MNDNLITLKLTAYHGDPVLKAFYVERMKAHRLADEIVQGRYWDGRKGCAVGCALEIDPDGLKETIHQHYETVLGIPQVLARLQDGIFEGLSVEDAKDFPVNFLEAVPVGADLSGVADQFLLWLLIDPEHGVIRFADERDKVAIKAVAALYRRKIAGEIVSDAAAYAADAAAYAADAAAYAAAYAVTDVEARKVQAAKLIALIAEIAE